MKIIASILIWDRIAKFYHDAKIKAHPHSYGWDEVFKDIDLAAKDTNFKPCNSSRQDWITKGYKAVINQRGWVFAYKMVGGDMYIFDVENYRNLNMRTADTSDLDFYQKLSSLKATPVKTTISLGYGWYAIRREDGYLYIQDGRGNVMPNIRFNEIVKAFRKRRDDANVYAIGRYGEKNFKLYLNGKFMMLERRNVLRLTERQFKQMIVECVSKILKEIA